MELLTLLFTDTFRNPDHQVPLHQTKCDFPRPCKHPIEADLIHEALFHLQKDMKNWVIMNHKSSYLSASIQTRRFQDLAQWLICIDKLLNEDFEFWKIEDVSPFQE